jgi:coenzyme F420-reducing hydrogenase delta subunit
LHRNTNCALSRSYLTIIAASVAQCTRNVKILRVVCTTSVEMNHVAMKKLAAAAAAAVAAVATGTQGGK